MTDGTSDPLDPPAADAQLLGAAAVFASSLAVAARIGTNLPAPANG